MRRLTALPMLLAAIGAQYRHNSAVLRHGLPELYA